jgi:hypothetical protein
MNLHATQLHESELDRGGVAPGSPAAGPPGRFAYASGARPLQGYTIKRGIGHGGFGEVYYATSDAGKEVALKLIRRNLDIELRGVTQCLNLKHPNLLSLFDVRQDDKGDNWVVMELMAGESLEDVLNRYPNGLPIDEVLAWIHGIAAGVAYLHDHGIVHRDLKPGNIFVDEGIVKIGDYGLSKFISCSRRSGQTGSVGTVHYMAPEISNGRYGKEIDIYALGIILYEMLTGHVPFEGESVGEILMKHLTAEPDVSRVAEPYRTIVSRALAKDPAKRLNSVNELIALLPPAPPNTAVRFAGPNAAVSTPIGGPRSANASGFDLAPQIEVVDEAPKAAAGGANATAGQAAAAGKNDSGKSAQEDPVVRWARETGSELKSWWERKNFKPWQKLVILALCLWVAVNVLGEISHTGSRGFNLNFGSILIIAAIGYAIYRSQQSRRAANRDGGGSSSPFAQAPRPSFPAAKPVVAPQPAPVRDPLRESQTRRRWRQKSYLVYQPGPPRERITQLIGSMLLSGLACAVIALVLSLLRGKLPEPNQYAWLAVCAILGSWAVLIPAKFWESSRGDAALRRFVMLVIGLALGATFFALTQWLMVSILYDGRGWTFGGPGRNGLFYGADGSPESIAFFTYFGFLFVLLRWWRLADPLRSTRLSIWHTAVAVFWAAVLSAFWPFPQPWGLMLAATIAIAVQLSAPWLTPAERAQLPRPASGG